MLRTRNFAGCWFSLVRKESFYKNVCLFYFLRCLFILFFIVSVEFYCVMMLTDV